MTEEKEGERQMQRDRLCGTRKRSPLPMKQ